MTRDEQKSNIVEILDVVNELRYNINGNSDCVVRALNHLDSLWDCMSYMDCERFLDVQTLKGNILHHYILNSGYHDLVGHVERFEEELLNYIDDSSYDIKVQLENILGSMGVVKNLVKSLINDTESITDCNNVLSQIKFSLERILRRVDNSIIVEYIN